MIKIKIVKMSDSTEFKIRGSTELKNGTLVPSAVKMDKIKKRIIKNHLNLLKVPTKKITPLIVMLISYIIYSFSMILWI